ncbi:MAG: hypothetical protein ACLGPL_02715 [Acidobacteriota bacterium]
MPDTLLHEKKAIAWDRMVTIVIVALLFIPLPFARVETWPNGSALAERIVTPWTTFQLCYTDLHSKESVEDRYAFTWKGELLPQKVSNLLIPMPFSVDPPTLKWWNAPELSLKEAFYRGDFLRVKTFWQPVILWPLGMGLGLRSGG